ncbi:hypothetical protein [Mesorhizobium sp. 128a]
MPSSPLHKLGVLELEYGLLPNSSIHYPVGAVLHPETFGIPVIKETVANGWADQLIPGDPNLEESCVAAARRLVERGASIIAADCGFFVRHQRAVAAAVPVPVALSSLLMTKTAFRLMPPGKKLAVVTADANCCSRDLLGVDEADQARIVIGGIEGGEFWHQFMKRPPAAFDYGTVEKDFVACVEKLLAEHSDIGAILFECTAIPIIAPAMRKLSKLPQYDVNNLIRMLISAAG